MVDCPAGLRVWRFRRLVANADVVIVPILPSPFDERTASRFIKRILKIKSIRKSQTVVGIVRNRVRVGTRASSHLATATTQLKATDIGEIRDRALYVEVAANGLGVFDLRASRIESVEADWYPLLRYVETASKWNPPD